jgi:hypothetical protein
MINDQQTLSYQLIPDSYGQVRAFPLLIANQLNSKLEQWFQNYKYEYLGLSNLQEVDFNKSLQLEYTYSLRVIPLRNFSEIKSDVLAEIDLLNYHQLIKIIHDFVERINNIYFALKEPKHGATVIAFKDHIDNLCLQFHRRNFPEKLELISKHLALQSSLEILNQINRARNCLEHRGGIVSEKDCDPGKSYLSIQWTYPKITSSAGDLSPLSQIKGRRETKTIFAEEVRRFQKDERILFDFYDNSKCIFSVNVCFKKIIDGLYKVFNVDQETTPVIIREFRG